ncbi:dihydrolipoyllysine-residue succinyltransferase, E2 component of oxoglutarate dehydrogenase complex [Oesophagostomum dentatum]|uniref:Dihydrolipoyllysine-residue succinyltransferase component of 2-oxoglutarate dehydrogenase complex, mitochondrial n=1 Tax=Oesophagostomum dentatum TaxID=61180 RepID=A0A0B1SWP0_OESDE|nr:dihydrolipoyllysine-residue succinyltransferase, E2 component of oxoglutarate dehydrogenase complex [Oesophagostomum dentatum]
MHCLIFASVHVNHRRSVQTPGIPHLDQDDWSQSSGSSTVCHKCCAAGRSLSASTRVPIAQMSFVPIRAIHASGIRLSDVIVVKGPEFAESISEGDIRWIKKVGDFVNEDELVAEIETDKTSVEVPAPQAGTIVELLVEDGAKVVAKQEIYKLQPGSAPAGVREIPKSPPAVSRPPPRPMTSTPVASIPVQRITVPSGSTPEVAITGAREEIRVKMNRMRLRIASRLKDAQNTYAMLTTFNEIDMSNIIEMRARYQKDFMKKHGVKLGLMSPFVRAAAYALQESPVVNAVIDENEIIYRHFVDMSIAVATPKGLVVPVLRNVESMNYAQIEKELAALGEKARDNKLAVEDMEGGTFTISNGGVFGSVFGTPIINPPQSAILGMHGIFDTPVAINGKVEIRPIMKVALTYDHRLIDGREAVTFLRKIKSAVEIRPIMKVALTYDHRLIDGREAVTFLRKIKSAVEDPRTILMNL